MAKTPHVIIVYPDSEDWYMCYGLDKFCVYQDKVMPVPDVAKQRNGADWYYPASTELAPYVIYYGTWEDELHCIPRQIWVEVYGSKFLWECDIYGALDRRRFDSSLCAEKFQKHVLDLDDIVKIYGRKKDDS